MIVYGDLEYTQDAGTLMERLRASLSAARGFNSEDDLTDRLHSLLIRAGELQQGMEDFLAINHDFIFLDQIEYCRALTHWAARAFYAEWSRLEPTGPTPEVSVTAALRQFQEALDSLRIHTDTQLTIKTPEGFAFYTLYPEQYCASALAWLRDHQCAPEQCAVVLGIRSIGTTLGALVSAVLSAAGWSVTNITVRPEGHPFERSASIGDQRFTGDQWALIMDEGPGLSGSSMVAGATALISRGLRPERISFLPGHSNPPGEFASGTVRDWWTNTPVYVAGPEDTRISGETLSESLQSAAKRFSSPGRGLVDIADVSGGGWRHLLFAQRAEWPPLFVAEPARYLCSFEDGLQMLFTFGGINSDPQSAMNAAATKALRISRLSELGFAPGVLGVVHGFIATEWLRGEPPRLGEDSQDVPSRMGQYIAHSAAPVLSRADQESSLERLRKMLSSNLVEILEPRDSEMAMHIVEAAGHKPAPEGLPSYGDGRLEPWNFVLTTERTLMKNLMGAGGDDHTIIGRQTVVWDLAGAIVEWGFNEASAGELLRAFENESGIKINADSILFFRIAYCAFRASLACFSRDLNTDAREKERLQTAAEFYGGHLKRLLIDY